MKTPFIYVVGLVVASLCVMSLVLATEKCYQPSSLQKPCSSRPNEVSSCDTPQWSETVCKSKRIYTIPVDVPRSEVESSSGATYTVKIDCVKEYGCLWNTELAICYGHVINWDNIPFNKEDKITDDSTVTCPPSE
jgi:hypothetical protein